jgi:hypothetical protein
MGGSSSYRPDSQGWRSPFLLLEGKNPLLGRGNPRLPQPSGVVIIPQGFSTVGCERDARSKQQHAARIVHRFIVSTDDDHALTLQAIGITVLTEKQDFPRTLFPARKVQLKMS